MTTTIEEYVAEKVLPEQRDVVAMLRALVRETAPDSEELISYGMLVFKRRQIFAWIIGTKRDITFSFTRGANFEDKHELLKGRGKHARHIKLKALTDVDRETLRYYLEQALEQEAT